MKIIFTKNNSIPSRLIRLFTWSNWHHIGIIDQDYVLEASFKDGVIKTPYRDFIAKYDEYEVAEIKGDVTKAYKELGKPYDLSAIFGIFFRRTEWEDHNKWFCSELVAHCTTVFRDTKTNRITPEHIYMVSKTI